MVAAFLSTSLEWRVITAAGGSVTPGSWIRSQACCCATASACCSASCCGGAPRCNTTSDAAVMASLTGKDAGSTGCEGVGKCEECGETEEAEGWR